MNNMFSNSEFNGELSEWNVSQVENMNYIFSKSKFRGDLSKWDVSHVESMSGMFENTEFDGDISEWDISHVEDMRGMFLNYKGVKPWWYIEDFEERRKEIEFRRKIMGLKEKISKEIKNQNGGMLF